jgi:hypothetical protein
MVHISYNAMPAWQGAIGLQRLIYEAGIRSGGRSDHRADAGLALARELKEAEGRYLTESPLSRDLIDNIHGMSKEYLSHEYMSAHWAPAFHADVARTMAEAKLDWVASANPLENFPELMLTAEQRKLMDRFSDPIMRELIKDTCLPRQLRHDVYVRGARRLRNDQRDAAIARLAVDPVIGAAELQTTFTRPAGTAEMSDALKNLMAAAMRGPTTIGDLLALDPEHSNASELVSVLVGTSSMRGRDATRRRAAEAANRLNRLLGSRIRSVGGWQGFRTLAHGPAPGLPYPAPAVHRRSPA